MAQEQHKYADPQDNPLLKIHGLPPFSQVKPEHIKPAVEAAITRCKDLIIELTEKYKKNPSWDNIMAPIEEADDKFSKIWSTVSHLNGVKNTQEFREAYDECLPLVAEYSAWVGQYRPFYEVLMNLKNSDHFQLLTEAQQISIKNSIRDFKLTGVDLDEASQNRYKEITSRLSQLESTFANNVLDATHSYSLHITDENDIKGLPSGARNLARSEAEKRKLEGWVFTLDIPSYLPFITYCENRELRKEIYSAYNTRASDKGPDAGKWDNAPLMEEILKLRHEQAEILGYKSFAHLSLATKTASTPEEVLDFLYDLADKSKEQGLKEMQELASYAQEHGQDTLEPWDLAYWSEKLRQEKYSYNAEELRPYFPIDKVIAGMFSVAQKIYKVSFRPRYGVDVWDDNVQCFDIYDEYESKIGTFYMDLYAREGKRSGAWMDDCESRRYRADGALQLPVAQIVCNFTRPVNNQKSQLTHDEVTTLFHEFGHALNQLLTRIDIADVSGINGVPWDVVELPSQFNENFAWQEEVLNFLSCNVNTQEPLPAEKLNCLLAAKNFESAMAMLRQLEFAIFDFRIHLEYDAQKGARIFEILKEVKDKIAVIPQFKDARFPNNFTHVFAGGYAAGYYSYKWAEVLAADAFSRFEEEGILNPEVGESFKANILAKGGACDPIKAFTKFRGRKPTVDALLRYSGITAK